jgi:SAM-dependent methyltransferase
MLSISERDLRRHGPGNLLAIVWRQWRAERRLARRGIHFRDTDPQKTAAAYAAMTEAEFDAINARQDWANWRTIPRAMNGLVPDRPLRAVDLGSGAGSSTRVLAFFCPEGSHITGYEAVAALLDIARRRSYISRSGGRVEVDFVCQQIAQPLCDSEGRALTDRSVDLVHASGIIGHHLNGESLGALVAQIARILSADGAALLDFGPTMSADELTAIMARAGFKACGRYRSWWGDPTGQITFRR